MTNDKNQNWYALDITVDSNASEAIEFGLNELEALGTEINNLGKKATETLCVTGYFNELPDDAATRSNLEEALRIHGFTPAALRRIDSRSVENTDWLAEWKKHWKPTVSEKFIVAPTWETIEESEKIVIRIEPSMAFGTGTHETTRLCLKAIEEDYKVGESFYDVGTGTGILAIAVAKLIEKAGENDFRAFIKGCDTDEDSIKIALENTELNNVSEAIELTTTSISANDPKFDYVCANLTADVIVPLLPLLLEKTNRILVLSGILKEQEDSIKAELRKFDIEDPAVETSGEWISVKIKK
ncbi:MAG: ribosomal protein methyltransferase [Acidobacteria bacterium]|jgi:ribosomal protein L11 methyltransferase|nr:ribosomal protein methyltransferase [Acidobacteriota bacterium]